MSPEERELMKFILESQSAAAAEMREMREERRVTKEELRETRKELRETRKEGERHSKQIEVLASACHDLLEVERIHSRRLDRLENPTA